MHSSGSRWVFFDFESNESIRRIKIIIPLARVQRQPAISLLLHNNVALNRRHLRWHVTSDFCDVLQRARRVYGHVPWNGLICTVAYPRPGTYPRPSEKFFGFRPLCPFETSALSPSLRDRLRSFQTASDSVSRRQKSPVTTTITTLNNNSYSYAMIHHPKINLSKPLLRNNRVSITINLNSSSKNKFVGQ